MSWTYDDDFNEAATRWAKLPDGSDKDRLATRMMKRYLSIRQHDCGWCNLPTPERDFTNYPVRPPIPKELTP